MLFLEIKELSFIAVSNIGEGGGHGYPNDFCHWNIKVSYILEINLIFLKISFVYLFAARSRHGNTEAMFQYSLTWLINLDVWLTLLQPFVNTSYHVKADANSCVCIVIGTNRLPPTLDGMLLKYPPPLSPPLHVALTSYPPFSTFQCCFLK